MNFMFEWQEQYLTSERSECSFYHINIVMMAFLMIFRRFPKIFQNCSEGLTNVTEHFRRISENFRRCPKISEDFRRRPEDVSMIHQRI